MQASKKEHINKKRKLSAGEDEVDSNSTEVKHAKIDAENSHSLSPSPEGSQESDKNFFQDEESGSCDKDKRLSDAKIENLISDLFLVQMPKDFYKFYELCKEMSPNDPCNAFKAIQIQLVGPYDVLSNKIDNYDENDKDKFLRHWRYFYDPPEFQVYIFLNIN